MRKMMLALVTVAVLAASRLDAQAAAAPVTAPPLELGAVAPDFALPGATRFGVLRDQIHLSDYKGKTVVLAFFFRARTRG